MLKLGLVTLELILRGLKTPYVAGEPLGKLNWYMECEDFAVSKVGAYDEDVIHDSCDSFCGNECIGDGPNAMQMPFGPAMEKWTIDDDPIGDRDPSRDRAPRPDKKKFPWSIAYLNF
jgi:hypothetical protein